ncbi:hypothetical protein BJ508DRAFT_335680 [Ascobolus immersus RN42]|uniref:DNA 3'-5' helicase n=1 Tax=Ascobolus immersus RN42 TaxID=1160509 RepID=A0A3N4HBM6_ASCIM|nr:hypothetical protein BJ508DRAFT_335680 [Ascobolus immersus RN42]
MKYLHRTLHLHTPTVLVKLPVFRKNVTYIAAALPSNGKGSDNSGLGDLSEFAFLFEDAQHPSEIKKTIIFVDSKAKAQSLANALRRKLVEKFRLRPGDVRDIILPYTAAYSDSDREEFMRLFECGECLILICTDAASLGINIDNIEVVIQHGVTKFLTIEDIVQRCGRVARSPKIDGLAIIYFPEAKCAPIDSAQSKLANDGIDFSLAASADTFEEVRGQLDILYQSVTEEHCPDEDLSITWFRKTTGCRSNILDVLLDDDHGVRVRDPSEVCFCDNCYFPVRTAVNRLTPPMVLADSETMGPPSVVPDRLRIKEREQLAETRAKEADKFKGFVQAAKNLKRAICIFPMDRSVRYLDTCASFQEGQDQAAHRIILSGPDGVRRKSCPDLYYEIGKPKIQELCTRIYREKKLGRLGFRSCDVMPEAQINVLVKRAGAGWECSTHGGIQTILGVKYHLSSSIIATYVDDIIHTLAATKEEFLKEKEVRAAKVRTDAYLKGLETKANNLRTREQQAREAEAAALRQLALEEEARHQREQAAIQLERELEAEAGRRAAEQLAEEQRRAEEELAEEQRRATAQLAEDQKRAAEAQIDRDWLKARLRTRDPDDALNSINRVKSTINPAQKEKLWAAIRRGPQGDQSRPEHPAANEQVDLDWLKARLQTRDPDDALNSIRKLQSSMSATQKDKLLAAMLRGPRRAEAQDQPETPSPTHGIPGHQLPAKQIQQPPTGNHAPSNIPLPPQPLATPIIPPLVSFPPSAIQTRQPPAPTQLPQPLTITNLTQHTLQTTSQGSTTKTPQKAAGTIRSSSTRATRTSQRSSSFRSVRGARRAALGTGYGQVIMDLRDGDEPQVDGPLLDSESYTQYKKQERFEKAHDQAYDSMIVSTKRKADSQACSIASSTKKKGRKRAKQTDTSSVTGDPQAEPPATPAKPKQRRKQAAATAPSSVTGDPQAEPPATPAKPKQRRKQSAATAPSSVTGDPQAEPPATPAKPKPRRKQSAATAPSSVTGDPQAEPPATPAKPRQRRKQTVVASTTLPVATPEEQLAATTDVGVGQSLAQAGGRKLRPRK